VKRILVMSDTHGNQTYLRKVCQSEQFDILFHLGDDYSDLENNFDLIEAKQVFKVPGLMNHVSSEETIPMVQHVIIESWRFQLVHRKEDTESQALPEDLVLFGHTHHPVYYFQNGIQYANPGHLKSSHHRNHHASYLLITLNDDRLILEWKDIQGLTFEQQILNRSD
jgi:uncharacterized protein